jgi:hypothetical protein
LARPVLFVATSSPANFRRIHVEIESKEDAKKRGQQSRDRAEALVLAFARVVPRHQTVVWSDSVTISPV